MAPQELDPASWPRVSQLLDELLDQPDATARAARLAELRARDAALAEQLAELLARLPSLDMAGFLAAPALPPPPPLGLAGQRVGAYRLLHEIGHGGMGTVWLAERADGRYQGRVAIKFMRAALLRPSDSERFLREGQMLAKLDHPNIARLLDAGVSQAPAQPAGQAAGQPYLVMDHVDGLPIDRFCEVQRLDIRARVQLLRQVLAAVAHAHSRLVLHRDLKPSNILVTAEGVPKLLDFGVGKLMDDGASESAGPDAPTVQDLTRMAGLAFTVRYAAPEQLQGQEVTTATDVYALGVLLYELLGGGHPTAGAHTTLLAQLQAVTQTEPRPLSTAVLRADRAGARAQARLLRGDLDTIAARALKKNPAERYANAAALSDELRRWLDREPISARRDGARYRIGRFMLRHRRSLVAAGTAAALALMAGGGAALWQAREARAQRAQAEGLVAFMLGDLQRKLVEIGRPDLLQAVGARALDYFARDDLQALDAPALAQRAQALRMIGESARQRLDPAQAREAFEQAANTTAQLLALAPKDMQRLQDHADSLERLAYLMGRTLDAGASLALCQQISALRWRMAALAPDDPARRLHAIDGDDWPIQALIDLGKATDSLTLLRRMQHDLRSLPAGLSGLPRVRAVLVGLTGQAQLEAGRYAEAADSLRAFLAMQPARHDALPDVTERGENLQVADSLVMALLNQGQMAPATAVATQALADAESDADRSPDNLLLAETVIRFRTALATLRGLAGDTQSARQHLAAIDTRLARLGTVPADNTRWHLITLGDLLVLRARLQPPASADAEAAAAWMPALQAHAARLASLDAQGIRLYGSRLAGILAVGLVQGDALLAQGQPEAARQRWQGVADRALPEAQKGDHPSMQTLALALLRLGQPQQARPWVERLEASTWRHPDLADLRKRLAQAERAQHSLVSTPARRDSVDRP